jgi:hypothetical protein
MTAHGQNPVNIFINDDTGFSIANYTATWTVFTINPYTTYPCDIYTDSSPTTTISTGFFANVNDVKDPVFYVKVKVIGYSSWPMLLNMGDNIIGPMTTAQLQGAWDITVTVN